MSKILTLALHDVIIIIPKNVPNKNPTIVSYVVTHICFNKSFEVKFNNVFHILDG